MKKVFHKRYVVWFFWHSICKMFKNIRQISNFYEDTIYAKEAPHTLYKKDKKEYNLKEIGMELTDSEIELIRKAWCKEVECITNIVVHKCTILKYENAKIIGNTGNIVKDNKIIVPNKDKNFSLGYRHVKVSFKKPIKKTQNELFFSIVGVGKEYNNFYHFFIDYLPKVFHVVNEFVETPITIIVNKDLTSYQKFAYENIEKLYPNIKIVIMQENEVWDVPNLLYVIDVHNVHNSFVSNEYLDFVRNIFMASNKIELTEHIKGNRYYISRNDTKNRQIENEDGELKAILDKYGFEIIYPSRMSLKEQIKNFSNAEVIVAPAGAALTNLLYVRAETKIVGFYPANLFGSCYIWLCKAVGIKEHYHVMAGEQEGKRGNYSIDKDLFEKYISKVCKD